MVREPGTNGTGHERDQPSKLRRSTELLLEYGGVFSLVLLVIVGFVVNYRVSAVIGCAASWMFFGVGYVYSRRINTDARAWWPRTFDWLLPILMALLLPVALLAGDDFARLWMGVIITGMLTATTFFSLVIGRPLLVDWLPDEPNADPGVKQILDHVRYRNTVLMGIWFAIATASQLVVAVLELKGTGLIVFMYVIPNCIYFWWMPHSLWWNGTRLFVQSAKRRYGPDWQERLSL